MTILSVNVENHICINENTEIICCRYCGSDDYNKRGKTKNDRQLYICKRCKRNFRSVYQSDLKDQQVQCHHCNSSNYQKKGKNQSGNQIYFCNSCKRGFLEVYIVGVYDKSLTCHHCGKSNYKKGGICSLTGKQRYSCQECHRSFQEIYHSVMRDPAILCRYCGSNDYYKKGYMQSGKQRYLCQDCDRHFAENYDNVLCTYCGSEDYVPAGFRKDEKVRRYQCQSCGKRFQETYVYKAKSQDYILLSDLGIDTYKHRYQYVVSFDGIHQKWLRDFFEQFIRYMAPLRAQGTILGYLLSINRFSQFLSEHYLLSTLETINRSVVVHYIQYLTQSNVTLDGRQKSLSHLRKFFDIGNLNDWFSISSYLIYTEDFSGRKPQHIPRYIPEDIVQQINQNLDKLYEPVMRMVLVNQEFGMRVSELLTLKCHCIEQDSKGQWSLQLFRRKTKKEDRLPIVNPEIVRVIQEQQNYIHKLWDGHFEYLFCSNQIGSYDQFRPNSKIMSCQAFNKYLNSFAKAANIRDSSGKLWYFQSHQFRHTVGTRMINNGVPQHIVQRYLGHASADMTSVYAHIHDQTLRKAAEAFHERIVNISGEVIPLSDLEIEANSDLNWIRKQISAQALPNGYCARPLVKGPCPHANACLTCGDFRTTQEFLETHKDELRRTEELISAARLNGWQRQVEMNEIVAINLRKMIVRLEAS